MANPFPYRLYGGATRADAISGLDPAFSGALTNLYAAAPPNVQSELGLNSAYRSIERQRELWEASDKSGKMVAAPGRSKHNAGQAADLFGFGLGGGARVSDATRDWVTQNAGAHGLYFPMDYEPWHIQLQGAGSAPQNFELPVQDDAAAVENPLAQAFMQRAMGGVQPDPGPPQPGLFSGEYGMSNFGRDLISGQNPLRREVFSRIATLFGLG